jgi:hypothetical protein
MLNVAFYLVICWVTWCLMSLCWDSYCWMSDFIYCYAECQFFTFQRHDITVTNAAKESPNVRLGMLRSPQIIPIINCHLTAHNCFYQLNQHILSSATLLLSNFYIFKDTLFHWRMQPKESPLVRLQMLGSPRIAIWLAHVVLKWPNYVVSFQQSFSPQTVFINWIITFSLIAVNFFIFKDTILHCQIQP